MQDAPKESPVLNYAAPDLEKSRAQSVREMLITALAIVGGFAIAFSSFLLLMWDRTYALR